MKGLVVETLKGTPDDWKLEVVVPFLSVKRNWWVTSPPHSSIPGSYSVKTLK